MKSLAKTAIAAAMILVLTLLAGASDLSADPCLIVYPDIPCVYHFSTDEYYTVGPGDSLYDAAYDRGGEVLIELGTNEIAYNIYQAPNLIGFEPSMYENEGFAFVGDNFALVLDGFSNKPTTYENVLIVFDDVVPEGCTPTVFIDGNQVFTSTFAVGDLVVSTPTPDGNNYSDTITIDVYWTGCYGVHFWAFADENYNGVLDLGDECFTAYSHDSMIDADNSTWGGIKSIYR